MHTPKTEQLTIQDYRKPDEEKLYYKATLDILKCSEEGTKCNFQGLLVVCDDIPRNVIYLDPSLRKRKASGAEGKVADVIFIDKTGAIKASLCGELAEEICMWRQMHESWKRGQGKACFVDLLNVRILAMPNALCNGVCITRHCVLNSVEGVHGEGGTTMKMLETPTSIISSRCHSPSLHRIVA